MVHCKRRSFCVYPHDAACLCSTCVLEHTQGLSPLEVLDAIRQREQDLIARIGWVAHALADRPLIHTHGLWERFHHLDLEIRLPVSPEKRYALLAPVADAVTNGQRFAAGDEDYTLFSVPIRFIARDESARQVLRVVFPDPQGYFPDNPHCPPVWAEQVLQDL
ncbi:MAG: hypothetical protein C7B43_18330 [Sulfobacillus benefaciens]|uniref:Uncharacterized protein n=1 Tax=Sulfobacillus benefaciens TaxID=453960 RepID=A0A2T2WR44_9FIRM|nr:MAG: hypothetical protein C7B43_18330 [Sulfobacillus benefaciens]